MNSLSLVEPLKEWTGIGLGTDGKFRIDGSALKAGYKCTTNVVLRYGWGLTAKAEKASLLAGTAGHAAIAQHLLDGGVPNWEDAPHPLTVFDATYKDWAQVNVAGDDQLSWANTRRIIEMWINAHPMVGNQVKGWPFTVDHVEVPFETVLDVVDGVEIVFVGRMDVLGTYQGYPVVVDHKTTKSINQWWKDEFSMSSQITGYCYAAREVLRKPVIGAFIHGVEWQRPVDLTRKCSKHGVKRAECDASQHPKWELSQLYERNEQMIEDWRAQAIPMAQNLYHLFTRVGDNIEDYLQQLEMEGPFTGECKNCEFRKGVCEVGRRPAVARGALEFNPWNPLEV